MVPASPQRASAFTRRCFVTPGATLSPFPCSTSPRRPAQRQPRRLVPVPLQHPRRCQTAPHCTCETSQPVSAYVMCPLSKTAISQGLGPVSLATAAAQRHPSAVSRDVLRALQRCRRGTHLLSADPVSGAWQPAQCPHRHLSAALPLARHLTVITSLGAATANICYTQAAFQNTRMQFGHSLYMLQLTVPGLIGIWLFSSHTKTTTYTGHDTETAQHTNGVTQICVPDGPSMSRPNLSCSAMASSVS